MKLAVCKVTVHEAQNDLIEVVSLIFYEFVCSFTVFPPVILVVDDVCFSFRETRFSGGSGIVEELDVIFTVPRAVADDFIDCLFFGFTFVLDVALFNTLGSRKMVHNEKV